MTESAQEPQLEYEWGVKYLDFNDNEREQWGWKTDPRLPLASGRPVIYDIADPFKSNQRQGEIYIGDDLFTVTAVGHRLVTPKVWEPFNASDLTQ